MWCSSSRKLPLRVKVENSTSKTSTIGGVLSNLSRAQIQSKSDKRKDNTVKSTNDNIYASSKGNKVYDKDVKYKSSFKPEFLVACILQILKGSF